MMYAYSCIGLGFVLWVTGSVALFCGKTDFDRGVAVGLLASTVAVTILAVVFRVATP